MKSTLFVSLSCLALIVGLCSTSAWAAASDVKSDASRNEYIKNFQRIGLNTTTGDAMLLRILVESMGAKRGVEVGSATGFGALNMGLAFERTGGHLVTIDIDPEMVRATRQHLKATGLDQTVSVVEGDALKVLPALEGTYDFVFLDALKRDYLKYLKALEPKLTPNAMVVADNVVRFADEMRDFLDYMEKNPDYDVVILRASMEKDDGMAICYKLR